MSNNQQTYQEFLKSNPDILMADAFFEFFRFYPDATVEELQKIFKKEIAAYIFNTEK